MHEGLFHLGDSNGYGDGDGSGGSGMLVCPNTAWTSVLSYRVPSGQGQGSLACTCSILFRALPASAHCVYLIDSASDYSPKSLGEYLIKCPP